MMPFSHLKNLLLGGKKTPMLPQMSHGQHLNCRQCDETCDNNPLWQLQPNLTLINMVAGPRLLLMQQSMLLIMETGPGIHPQPCDWGDRLSLVAK